MTADTYDSIIGLIEMGTGNNNNNWGSIFNTSFGTPAGRAIGGVNTITSTGGTVDLSTVVPPAGLRADVDFIQLANGTLTSDLIVKVTNVSKAWWFKNATSGAFQMFVQVPSGVSPNGLIQIPQGLNVFVMCDGAGNLHRHDRKDVGSFSISGKAAPGAGEVLCNGASILRAEFPDLFNAIGTTWGSADSTHFTVPNLTDTNRFLRAGGGSGPAVGTYQSNQNLAHTHTVTGAPSAGTLGTDSQGSHTHSASVTDPGHTHTGSGLGVPAFSGQPVTPGSGAAGQGVNGTTTLSTNGTGISVTNGSAGAHTHNITGAPGLGTLGTASQGGTEARPESAAVLICIRY